MNALEFGADGFPAFFAAAPVVRVRDPLAGFLGAARGGELEYRYADAVRLAGHSCPTVASAFLLTRAALAALWPGELPERGAVRVEFASPAHEGVTGVIANVASLLTGATLEAGFKGIAGQFDRRHLLAFEVPMTGQVRFTRADTGAAALASARLERVPGDPRMSGLLRASISGTATPEQDAEFQALWQERVRRLLVEHADDREVIVVHPDA